MSKFRHQKYTYSNPFGNPRHHWEVVGAHGGVHFHVTIVKGSDASAGLEFHSIYPRGEDAPDHINCPLTGGRCWHDGTSLYASETLWPMIEASLRAGAHEEVFRILEHEAKRLEKYKPAYMYPHGATPDTAVA